MQQHPQQRPSGSLFIISAASGTGKTSLVLEVIKRLPNVKESVSYTTRNQRAGEVDGESYFFVDEKTFKQRIAEQDFLEYANVFDNFYGTSLSHINEQLNLGYDLFLTIDWQGAQNVRQKVPDATNIFLLPPSFAELRNRLESRHRDKEEDIAKRLKTARSEIAHCEEYDYLVVNDDFNRAVEDLIHIITTKRLSKNRQMQRYAGLIADLLKSE